MMLKNAIGGQGTDEIEPSDRIAFLSRATGRVETSVAGGVLARFILFLRGCSRTCSSDSKCPIASTTSSSSSSSK